MNITYVFTLLFIIFASVCYVTTSQYMLIAASNDKHSQIDAYSFYSKMNTPIFQYKTGHTVLKISNSKDNNNILHDFIEKTIYGL